MLHVLCAVDDDALAGELAANLADVAGPHRLHTLTGAPTIARAYNALVAGSGARPGDTLAFLHQDARLHFDARRLEAYFKRLPRAGVLGFCGSARQVAGRAWHRCLPRYGSLLQGRHDAVQLAFDAPTQRDGDLAFEPVHTLDGYALVLERATFDRIGGFDEGYDGWHGYDLELCARALDAGRVNYVIAEPTQHFSWGSAGPAHDRALMRFAARWTPLFERLAAASPPDAPAAAPTPAPAREPLKIHVYAIAKNEAAFARRFAASCRGADGVHVLDTGSDDDTVAILRAEGVHVEVGAISPWRFDLARNLSLELVPDDADVCLSIDLDEVLVEGWREVVEAAWTPGTTRLRYRYAWQMAGDVPVRAFRYDKAHARRGYVWVAPVHEVVVPVAGFEERGAEIDAILVRHYPDPAKSRAQYLPLLELAVREDAGDARCRFYLGREYGYARRWHDAIATLGAYLRMPTGWSFERAAAATLIAGAHAKLGEEARARGDDADGRHRDAEAFRWALRATHEAPDRREPWVALADVMRGQGDAAGSHWAATKALAIGSPSGTYLDEPDAWSWKPHDLAALAAWSLGRHDDALAHAFAAVEQAPDDDRLVSNYLAIQSARAATRPPAEGPPLVDAVVLSYARGVGEYEMTRRCVASLAASGPDVPLRIVVVETNTALADEPFVADRDAPYGPGVDIVMPGGRFGYNAYAQAGLAHHASAPARYALLLNNDVVLFADGFLRAMIGGLAHVGSVSPLGLREAKWNGVDRSIPLVVNYHVNSALTGWCLMFDREATASIPLEELLPRDRLWYGADLAYAAALERHGVRHGLVTAARALHLGQRSHALLGRTIAAPADFADAVDSLPVRHCPCGVFGRSRSSAVDAIRAYGPAALLEGDAPGADLAPGRLALVHLADDRPARVATALDRLWPAIAPGGWLLVGAQDRPPVAAALAAFLHARGATPAFVTRDGRIAGVQKPS